MNKLIGLLAASFGLGVCLTYGTLHFKPKPVLTDTIATVINDHEVIITIDYSDNVRITKIVESDSCKNDECVIKRYNDELNN